MPDGTEPARDGDPAKVEQPEGCISESETVARRTGESTATEETTGAPDDPVSGAATETMIARLSRLALWIPVAPWLLAFAQYRRGGDSIVRQHDYLDASIPIHTQMSLSDLFAPPGQTLPFILGGLERDFVGSELHIGIVLTVLLPVVWSMFVNELLIRTLAFVGSTYLLRRILPEQHRLLAYVVASLFAMLPFYAPAFGAVAGIPLLVAALDETYHDQRLTPRTFAIFALFPLYTTLAFTIPPLVLLALILVAMWRVLDRRGRRAVVMGVTTLLVSSAIVDWRFIAGALRGVRTHRVEMIGSARWDSTIWSGLVGDVMTEDLLAHAFVGRSAIVGLTIAAGIVLAVAFRSVLHGRERRVFVGALLLVPIVHVVGNLWQRFEVSVMARLSSNWGRFQMERVDWTEPTIVMVLLALSALAVSRWLAGFRRGDIAARVLLVMLFVLQGAHLVGSHPFRAQPGSLSIADYYAIDTFGAFRSTIEAGGGGRAVSVGVHPAVAVYNGIHSADGYWNVYELTYKHRFRELIAPALAESPADKAYFDNWGSRAYVFQRSLGRPPCCWRPAHAPFDLVVEPAAFGRLGITHVISSATIENSVDVGLEEVDRREPADELGLMVLYRVIDR